ncbi:sigma-70 family RNA polymerase sigma factor [Halobacillus aidingensis]|uniref:RNA polymerase sigma-70 factor, ECF subfamily n=1 Tax=Halobacillus aidingensis TaxID=240303 RepID=A0A1H0FTA0_HALAD|nr:sigma-70 family RNA polymerase sigma factor [Halobacillus aidingensis]SDN97719.1 RNA polymerase sigma-70 factor, ECF subfamily [Halobacillus aidingensis]
MNEEHMKRRTDKEMLADLMESYGDMVVRIAFTYVKEKQLAEDLAQEVFIRCYQHLHTFEHRSSYKTWVYRITVNHCKDHVRSWSFRNLIPFEPMKMEKGEEANSIIEQVLKEEENEVLFQKVLKLTVKLREVIIFYYYEELSVEEVAELLEINVNTVKTRLHRARNSLKRMLKGGEAFE